MNGWLLLAMFFVACAIIVSAWLAWAMKHVPYIRHRQGDGYAQLDKLLRDDQRPRARRMRIYGEGEFPASYQELQSLSDEEVYENFRAAMKREQAE